MKLRTPVNILLGKNQVMLSQERSAEEYQQALVDNIEELEGLSRLTENILFLARAEHQNIAVKNSLFRSMRWSKICWIILAPLPRRNASVL